MYQFFLHKSVKYRSILIYIKGYIYARKRYIQFGCRRINFNRSYYCNCSYFLTRRQIKQGYEVQKATFFKELYQMMYGDPHIREAFYLIDYDKFVFSNNFSGSHEEQLVDHLLNFFDLLCGLYIVKMLSKQEMNFFEYEFKVVYTNHSIQAYLQYLRDVYTKEDVATMPYSSFVSYSEKELSIKPTALSH